MSHEIWNPRICPGHQRAKVLTYIWVYCDPVNIFMQLRGISVVDSIIQHSSDMLLHLIINNFLILISEKHPFSPHNTTQNTGVQVERIVLKLLNNNKKLTWYLNKFSQLVLHKMHGNQRWEFACWCYMYGLQHRSMQRIPSHMWDGVPLKKMCTLYFEGPFNFAMHLHH